MKLAKVVDGMGKTFYVCTESMLAVSWRSKFLFRNQIAICILNACFWCGADIISDRSAIGFAWDMQT